MHIIIDKTKNLLNTKQLGPLPSHSPAVFTPVIVAMELFGPHTVNSIADLLGINTNTNTNTNTNQANEREDRETAEEHEANRYLIRRGNEKDVFQENVRKSEDKSCGQGRLSDYTYDDYKNEFEREATAEEVYADDVRLPAEYEITDCETFQAGRLPDTKFFLVNISFWKLHSHSISW